jgi:hypothetical protein
MLKTGLLDAVESYIRALSNRTELLRKSVNDIVLKDSLFVKSPSEIENGLKLFDEGLSNKWQVYNNDLNEIHKKFNLKFTETVEKIYKQLESMNISEELRNKVSGSKKADNSLSFEIGNQKIVLQTKITGTGSTLVWVGTKVTIGYLFGAIGLLIHYGYRCRKESQWKAQVNVEYQELVKEIYANIENQKIEITRLQVKLLSELNTGFLMHINRLDLDTENLKKSLEPIIYVLDQLKQMYGN